MYSYSYSIEKEIWKIIIKERSKILRLKDISKIDPLKRSVEKDEYRNESSPMNPPDAYSPANVESQPYENLHPFLQELIDEHNESIKAINSFEEILRRIQSEGIKSEFDSGLKNFFHFLDDKIVKHNLKEEKLLFPLLDKRLKERGEHGSGDYIKTAVDLLEDDHIKVMQLASVTFNFLGLVVRLPDARSRELTLDAALNQGRDLIELLRLHIFREDNIVFMLAHKYITITEFNEMQKNCSMFDYY